MAGGLLVLISSLLALAYVWKLVEAAYFADQPADAAAVGHRCRC